MSEIQIPERSLARLRAAYQQFEQISGLVAEAMGLDPAAVVNINVEKGVFSLRDGDERQLMMPGVPHDNGVAA